MEWFSQWTFWLFVILVVLVVVLGILLYFVNRRIERMQTLINEQDAASQAFLSAELVRLQQELEQKMNVKEREFHSELNAMSMALTSLNLHASIEEPAIDDSEEDAAEEIIPIINSEQCFKSLSSFFIRNEQRLAAVEGGVSITTANKWLDAWERNGWIKKVSRGKYMKTLKGKKFSLTVH